MKLIRYITVIKWLSVGLFLAQMNHLAIKGDEANFQGSTYGHKSTILYQPVSPSLPDCSAFHFLGLLELEEEDRSEEEDFHDGAIGFDSLFHILKTGQAFLFFKASISFFLSQPIYLLNQQLNKLEKNNSEGT